MNRRQVILLLGGAAAWPLAARAQQGEQAQQLPRALRVGVVSFQPRTAPLYVAFEQRMTELGYEDGRNFFFDYVRIPNVDEYEAGYAELAARKIDIMIASGPEITLRAALKVAGTRPIVMVAVDYDPLARGYVTSLARPTGNVTGVFFQQIELTVKRLQLVRQAFPELQAATVFWDRISADQWQAAQGAAATLGLRLAGVEFREHPYDYERGLAQVPPDHRRLLIVLASPAFALPRARLPDFALRRRMGSMFHIREYPEAGGLMSYGPRITDLYRRVADYVDRLARGAKPVDLPIEQPTKFELVINLKTAKALGLDLPDDLLALADEVIE
jgi:putative tryptophan/tyrosine transport system substrate-binding protein